MLGSGETTSEMTDKELPSLDIFKESVNADAPATTSIKGHDAVFGIPRIDGAPNYVNVGWIRAAVFLMKSQVGLGVLGGSHSTVHKCSDISVPFVFSAIGLIPGILGIIGLSMMSTWSSYVVGTFKLRHPEVHSIADVGFILGGRFGKELLGSLYALCESRRYESPLPNPALIKLLTTDTLCICASGLLSISIALNALTNHGTCSVTFVVAGSIVVYFLSIIRTIDKISFLGWIGMVSIFSAIFTLGVAVGVQDRPAAAPQTGPWDGHFQLVGHPTFFEASSALGTIVVGFGGTPAFFNVVSEMRDPKDFPKTVLLCQSSITFVYLVVGSIVYAFCGDYITSPALGSAGPVLKKVCYGLALPALIVGSVIYLHLSAKYIFVRILRGGAHLVSNSAIHWITWLSSVLGCLMIAFFIAQAIPVFSGLIDLVGSLFGTIMSLSIMGVMWLYDHLEERHSNTTWRYRALVAWNIWMIAGGAFLMLAGTYGSAVLIRAQYAGKALTVFSCADNSA
ncbi:BZ3500_MvSof-1268-A1-R1_Chr8-1g09956 [Microbotryum saponariae]|uniref:BZ3500_MvSof-1268-A1-R1_Chr8-1g09956 protein n=1 Tax=Microbotryum saponariae TaxID=289078 RepID=A0A2X0NJS4_9BASI|nr:BZ3500_MvSof-1268-A1-R1_Chr8-1g09956 [Microbotryum saponariae]SDA08242.1 BZ3501_MvSof-1269-A2-R1_Chr8-1g09679 [Microbotryum saponariae]